MIVDKLQNIMMYELLVKGLSDGIEKMNALTSMEEGKYHFESGYLMIQKGETKPIDEGTFEAHRKYIDVQVILEGSEEVAWADVSDLTSCMAYDSLKDVERFEGDASHSILISAGMFYIVFPHDGHKPVSHRINKQKFTKVVIKLPVI